MSDSYYKDPDGNVDHQDSGDDHEPTDDYERSKEDDDDGSEDEDNSIILAPRRNVSFQTVSAIPVKAGTELQPVIKNQTRPAAPGSKLPESIDACLDELGLKPSNDAPAARIDFNNDVRTYLTENTKQGNRNRPTLDMMVTDFGNQYGLKFWGCNNRGRLANPNVETGLSWTRDFRGKDSRVLAVLKQLFRLKVKGIKRTRRRQEIGKKRGASLTIAGQSPPKRRTAATIQAPCAARNAPQQVAPRVPSAINDVKPKADVSTSYQAGTPAPTAVLHGQSGLLVAQQTMTNPALSTSGTAEASETAGRDGESNEPPWAPPQTSTHPQLPLAKGPGAAPNMNKQLAAIEQKTEIYLMVSATTKDDRAPVYVPFHPNTTTEDLFASMISECGVGSGSVKECSATLCWKGGARLLIRKGKQDDIDVIQKWISQAWRNDASRFKDGVEIGMLLHVDG
ncbi:MAG: hypothetical protein Q9208_005958 [Pyrenodesmia sp. 3 TL-2023]